MTQKAKQWLSRQQGTFEIDPQDGGIVGSLISLGYVKRLSSIEYEITQKGNDWVRNQREKIR